MSDKVLHIWVLYDHPTDFPTMYVARSHAVYAGKAVPTEEMIGDSDLEVIRSAMERRGLTCIPRSESDDEKIIESWL